jgi:hypothetical protein
MNARGPVTGPRGAPSMRKQDGGVFRASQRTLYFLSQNRIRSGWVS